MLDMACSRYRPGASDGRRAAGGLTCGGARRLGLEGQRGGLVGVAKQAAIAQKMQRQRQHRPLDLAERGPPQAQHDRDGDEAVGEVVQVVIDRRDADGRGDSVGRESAAGMR